MDIAFGDPDIVVGIAVVKWSMGARKNVGSGGDYTFPILTKDSPGEGFRHVITAVNATTLGSSGGRIIDVTLRVNSLSSTIIWCGATVHGIYSAGSGGGAPSLVVSPLNVSALEISIPEDASAILTLECFDSSVAAVATIAFSGYTEAV